jgi:hypothetical protein
MAVLASRQLRRGESIACPWSSGLSVVEVLHTVEISGKLFRGILAEAKDENGWPFGSPTPIWVYDNGSALEVWHDIGQRPQTHKQSNSAIQDVIAHYEDNIGNVYYAIQWDGYFCPVWVLEEDLGEDDAITSYCLGLC